jgi:pimeloyl-ACP methyl ester carboxylesterase
MRVILDRVMPVLALALVLASLWQLEGLRRGVDVVHSSVGPTPVISYSTGGEGPVVVIAHGFAGSAQMMQAYALTLARAGYRVHSFDFQGHGRNPVPMSGDVSSVLGTTQLLVDQTLKVVDAVRDGSAPVALLGHSMATDVLIRAALERPEDTGPLVLLSAFSQAVTAAEPDNMLLIAGAGEPHLREFGVEALRMVQQDASEGDTVSDVGVIRAAVAAPWTEHVSILHSRAGQAAARDWLDAAYGRVQSTGVPASGWWLMGLLAGIVALARPLSRALPVRAGTVSPLEGRAFWLVALLPAAVVPVVATAVNVEVLPVMVADYLALHLLLMGVAQLAILWGAGVRPAGLSALGVAALVVWGLGAFGLALDRYGANFIPTIGRLWVIAALCIGTLPFMLADALATRGGAAPLWRRLVLRVAFFGSLIFAVVLDFEALFFLLLIAPVMVLFYIVFGLMGRWVAQRVGAASAGVGLGLILAWSLGVSFPFFAAGGGGG